MDTKYYYFKIGVHQAVLRDSWLMSSYDEQNLTYTNVNMLSFDSRIKNSNLNLLLRFSMDENVKTTTRTNYNLFDVLSNTGGFASIITLIFTILTKRV